MKRNENNVLVFSFFFSCLNFIDEIDETKPIEAFNQQTNKNKKTKRQLN